MLEAFKAFRSLMFILTSRRVGNIVSALRMKHNFDVSQDTPTMQTILGLVFVSNLTDDEIVKEIMEIHTVSGDNKKNANW